MAISSFRANNNSRTLFNSAGSVLILCVALLGVNLPWKRHHFPHTKPQGIRLVELVVFNCGHTVHKLLWQFLLLLWFFSKRSASRRTPQRSESRVVIVFAPSSTDFWMVNSIFSRREMTCPRCKSSEYSLRSRSLLIILTETFFFVAYLILPWNTWFTAIK